MLNERDANALKHIVKYCMEIGEAREIFGDGVEALQTHSVYKNATSMCILQIGELTTHLTDDFKSANDKMPWDNIKAMRNIAAHRYGSFSADRLWETISEDIPSLKAYCDGILLRNEPRDLD
jgi:uncharacterized protein with HEPN domain